jgi:hypothetical protein
MSAYANWRELLRLGGWVRQVHRQSSELPIFE